MAKPKSLNKMIEEAQKVREEFQTVSETEVPKTLQEAIDNRWQLTVSGLQLGYATHYDEDDYGPDSRRVMKLGKALQLIDDYEDWMVEKFVRDPKDVLRAKWNVLVSIFEGLYDIVRGAWSAVEAVIKVFWDNLDTVNPWKIAGKVLELLQFIIEVLWEFGERFTAYCFAVLVTAYAINDLVKKATRILTERDRVAEKMRKAAFPQRTGPRFLRRKVSRL